MTNVAVLVGNLTRDPEMRYIASGKAVVEFTIAVNEGFGEKRTTQFIRVVAWEKLAEAVAEMARKGNRVMVDGKLVTDSWKDKEGKTREQTRVMARNVAVIPSRPNERGEGGAASLDLSDIPF